MYGIQITTINNHKQKLMHSTKFVPCVNSNCGGVKHTGSTDFIFARQNWKCAVVPPLTIYDHVFYGSVS